MSIKRAEKALYEPILLPDGMVATRVGATFAPTLFLPCQLSTLPYIRGAMLIMANEQNHTGTEAEKMIATDVLIQQAMADALTQEEVCGLEIPWGAFFRALSPMLEGLQGEGLPPPPWEFRIDIRSGEYWLQFRTMEE